jgi:hypothetical protein
MYATNVVIIAAAPYLSVIYNTFNVLPAIVSVIQLPKKKNKKNTHSDEQQNFKKYVRFTPQQIHTKPNCVPVRTFPFRNNQINDSMEQSPSGEVPTASMSKKYPQFLWNPKVYHHVQKSPPHRIFH